MGNCCSSSADKDDATLGANPVQIGDSRASSGGRALGGGGNGPDDARAAAARAAEVSTIAL